MKKNINLRNAMLSMALLAQKTKINLLKLVTDIQKILTLFPPGKKEWNFLHMTIGYMLDEATIDKKLFIEAIEAIPEEIKRDIMSTYDQIKLEGEQIGIQKGEQIGIQKGEYQKTLKVVLNSYEQGLPVNIIANITNLSEEEVLRIVSDSKRVI